MSGTQTTEGFKLNLDLLARIYLFKARARVLAYNLGFFNCGLSRFFFLFFFLSRMPKDYNQHLNKHCDYQAISNHHKS